MQEFVTNLFSAAISSSVIILLVLIARAIFRNRLRPAAYTLLWGVLFLRLLMPIRLELPAEKNGEVLTAVQQLPERVISFSEEVTRVASPSQNTPLEYWEPVKTAEPLSAYEIAAICYSGIAGLLIIAFGVRNHLYIKKLDACCEGDAGELLNGCCEAMGVKRPKVLLVDRTCGTGVAGLFHKRLLLDDTYFGMSRQSKRAVLMHEMAHIHCGHMELLLLSYVLNAAYWFNPLVWIAMRAFRADLETAADYVALQRLSITDEDYAESLLMAARSAGKNRGAFLLSAVADKSRLKKRIKAILSFRSAKKVITAVCLIVAVLAAAVGCAVGAQPGEDHDSMTAAHEMLVSVQIELQPVTCSNAKESISKELLNTAEQLGTVYDDIVDFAYADLDGDGAEEIFLYYARGSGGMYTESGFGMAVIAADEKTVLEEFSVDGFYGYPRGQILPLSDGNGVKAVVLSAELGDTMGVWQYSILQREQGGWRELFSEYREGYPYFVRILDGPTVEVNWQELPGGEERSSRMDAEVSMKNGYPMGYFYADGSLTEQGQRQAENIESYGFARIEAGVEDDSIFLRGYQKITGLHKLDAVGELITEWQYTGGVWKVTGKTVPSSYGLTADPTEAMQQFFLMYFSYAGGEGDIDDFYQIAEIYGSENSVMLALQWAQAQSLALRLDPEATGLGTFEKFSVDTYDKEGMAYLAGIVTTDRITLDYNAVLTQDEDGKWLVKELDFPNSQEYEAFRRAFLEEQGEDYLRFDYLYDWFYPHMHEFFRQKGYSMEEALTYLEQRGLKNYFSQYLVLYGGKEQDGDLNQLIFQHLNQTYEEGLAASAERIYQRLDELKDGMYMIEYQLIWQLQEQRSALAVTDAAAAKINEDLLLRLYEEGFLYEKPQASSGNAAQQRITTLFTDPHDPKEQEEMADLDGDGIAENITLTDLHYNGGDGGYELAVFRADGSSIPLPQSYSTETGFPFFTRWSGMELEVCIGETVVAVLSAEQLEQLYEEWGLLPDYPGTKIQPFEQAGDALSGFVLQEREDGRIAILTKSYLWGSTCHIDCLGYGIAELVLNMDGSWDVAYSFLLDAA